MSSPLSFGVALRLVALTLVALGLSACTPAPEFTTQDAADVRSAVRAYVDAWLSNGGADPVMATLTPDIVLQPHHGVQPVVGAEAVRAWWFPEGPPTVITAFTMDIRGLSGTSDLAYVWGRSHVAWEYDGASSSNEGNALSIVRKGDDGVWRIAHQIWNDPLPQVQ